MTNEQFNILLALIYTFARDKVTIDKARDALVCQPAHHGVMCGNGAAQYVEVK